MKRRLSMLTMVALAAVIVAGCGSDEGTTTASIDKAQFIARADAICAAGSEQTQADLAAYLKKEKITLNENQTEGESVALIAILVDNVESEVESIRALGVPSGDNGQVGAILAALEEGAKEAEKDPVAVVRGEVNVLGKAGELAKEYGLRACGQR